MEQVLEGILVLDFTQGMAGPLATMIFDEPRYKPLPASQA